MSWFMSSWWPRGVNEKTKTPVDSRDPRTEAKMILVSLHGPPLCDVCPRFDSSS